MDYWNKRYLDEGKIWGELPSKSAKIALNLFKKNNAKSILVPGAGYGRNSKLFSDNNLKVVGIEISNIAHIIACKFDPKTHFIHGSVLDMPFDDEKYDAIYSFNILHLFLRKERFLFLNKCQAQLKDNGIVFFVVFSEGEKSFGKGRELEKNTFESKKGRPTHYFSKDDLIEHFRDYLVIKTGITKEPENHGTGPHIHILRYIFAQKKK